MGIEELMAGMSGMGGSNRPLVGDALAKFRAEYVHIPDLSPGDKVQWKRGYKDCKIPHETDVCEVFRIIPIIPRERISTSGSLDEFDFSVIFQNGDGDYSEYPFDSRRFERVE